MLEKFHVIQPYCPIPAPEKKISKCLLKGCISFRRQSFNGMHLFSSSFWLGMTPTTHLWMAAKSSKGKNKGVLIPFSSASCIC
jgi:hypothetical protein